MEQVEEPAEFIFPKANHLNRVIAKFIDLLIAMALSQILPPIGVYAGITYLFIADGFGKGQSVGKMLLGLQVRHRSQSRVNPFRSSVLRNVPLVAAFILFLIPYVGWFFFVSF